MPPLVYLSATEMARRIRVGSLSSTSLLEAHLERIAQVNPSINAVVNVDAEPARKRAEQADQATARGECWGPLHGVPFTAKDVFQSAGLTTTSIAMRYATHVPQRDAALVRRLKAAGAILLGKTNLPTASYDWQTNSRLLGRCNNPYELTRTVGGSSGGSAAALAAGMSPIELGSDVAGSLRVPAHFCGVAALRPTEGLLSLDGHGVLPGRSSRVDHLAVPGPMARSAEDLELLLPLLLDGEARPLHPLETKPFPRLRLAWSSSLGGIVPSQPVRTAMARLQCELVAAGATLLETEPDVGWAEAQRVWGTIQGHEIISSYPRPLCWWPFRWLLRTGVVEA
ncbi:MAG: amidase, partial [Myxococcales bacterium FL481]